jgi:hypothetical protein
MSRSKRLVLKYSDTLFLRCESVSSYLSARISRSICLQHSSTTLKAGEPTGIHLILSVDLLLLMYCRTFLVLPCEIRCFALSMKRYRCLNFLCTLRKSRKFSPSNVSYCLKSCSPSMLTAPNITVLLCDPVTLQIGRIPSGV